MTALLTAVLDASPVVLGGAALVMVSVVMLSVVLTSDLRTRKERRVDSIEGYVTGTTAPAFGQSRPAPAEQASRMTEKLVGFGERQMQNRSSTQGTMALMARADLPFRAGEWFVIQLVAGAVGAAGGALLARGAEFLMFLLACLLGLVAGMVLPTGYLRVAAARRSRAFEAVLPDVLALVSTSLRSGFGLSQALDAIARDAAEPAAKEFSRALAEARIGTEIEQALEHMATRMNSTAMRWTVMAIAIQREVGGNLADTLTTTASTLKERGSIQRQVRTLSAEGRLSAYILVALPIGIFLYMTVVNYPYISLLWTTTLGLVMLVAGIISLLVGIVWMRKVVTIEV